jgi:hypothetical protein
LDSNPRLTAAIFGALKEASSHSLDEITRMHAGGLQKIEPRELLEARLDELPPEVLNAAQEELV